MPRETSTLWVTLLPGLICLEACASNKEPDVPDASCPVSTCGNGILEAGEEGDPPPGPFPQSPLDPHTCRYDFSHATVFVCTNDCAWAVTSPTDRCGQPAANVLCQLKTGNSQAHARSFDNTTTLIPRGSLGFSCVSDPNLVPVPPPVLAARGVPFFIWYPGIDPATGLERPISDIFIQAAFVQDVVCQTE